MTKTAFLLTFAVTALASMSAEAQVVRAFVSANGSDANPCSVTQPCRTFQHAHDIVPANGMIWVLDPAGYQPLTITKGITIQANGMGEITAVSGSNAITVSVTTSDPVTLNGLVIDGDGTGTVGIQIKSGPSVQILNSVVRHFHEDGIIDVSSTSGSNLLIEDTIVSDNSAAGIVVQPSAANVNATLSRITANNNFTGVADSGTTSIVNSVISNNSNTGLNNLGTTWLAKTMISGNGTGISVGGIVKSYGDNYLNDNGTPVSGSLTPVSTR
jgi:hypothetical protein